MRITIWYLDQLTLLCIHQVVPRVTKLRLGKTDGLPGRPRSLRGASGLGWAKAGTPIQAGKLPASGPGRGPSRDSHTLPTPGSWPVARTCHASADIPGRSPKPRPRPPEARRRLFRRAQLAGLLPLVAPPLSFRLSLGSVGPVAQGTGSRQPPRPGVRPRLLRPSRTDESGGAVAGGESGDAAVGPTAPASRPAPLPRPPRRRSHLPQAALRSPRRLRVALPISPPFPAPASPRRVAEPECHNTRGARLVWQKPAVPGGERWSPTRPRPRWPAGPIPGPSLLPLRAFPPSAAPSSLVPRPSACRPAAPSAQRRCLVIDVAFCPPTLSVRCLPPRASTAGTDLGTHLLGAQ